MKECTNRIGICHELRIAAAVGLVIGKWLRNQAARLPVVGVQGPAWQMNYARAGAFGEAKL